MTSRTHDIFAFASLMTVAVNYPPAAINIPTLITALIGSVIGSLLPDIDQATNRLWDLLPAGDFIGRASSGLFLAHRTISHSILGTVIAYKIMEWLLPIILNQEIINVQIIFIAIMIGYISHLIADSLTEEGIPLFFPLKFKIGFPPIPSWRIKTGKWFEKFVVFPGILIYIVWFAINYQQKLLDLIRKIFAN
jgi:inner membrane protein